MVSNYDKYPYSDTGFDATNCAVGWDEIASHLPSPTPGIPYILCVECYPGVFEKELEAALTFRIKPAQVIHASEAYKASQNLVAQFEKELTEDPVFGRISSAHIHDFFDDSKLQALHSTIKQSKGLVLILGTGASLIAPTSDCLIYADMARWELQRRQRANQIGNLGLDNLDSRASEKYKRAFFLDWRVADRLKLDILSRADFVLDTNTTDSPKLITGEVFHAALLRALASPLRLVPFFDPGPWGGQWMKEKFDLPDGTPNYAWCFDCVPEENSLMLGFGDRRFEIPAQDLVLLHPDTLMGTAAHDRFGLDFPIRFDLLDTVGGGNLSFQVHPLTEYIQSNFGMTYTQDESYYLLDAEPDAVVYLGVKDGIDPATMQSDLQAAHKGGAAFPVENFTNRISAKKHDHFLIPAGTPHCSGAGSMVLEISATPYIFTFKLWDWARLGLDGRPRPIHLEHGLQNIQWSRTTAWVEQELVNTIAPIACGPGWTEERTGLHELEFIETRRHWFSGPVTHDTHSTVNVLNLVEGSAAWIESPESRFPSFVVHYAETFLIPAAVGIYTIRPANEGETCATLKAYVRTSDKC